MKLLMPSMVDQIRNEILTETLIKKKESLQKDVKPIHVGICCETCSVKDVEGIRYKCSVCFDFNVC